MEMLLDKGTWVASSIKTLKKLQHDTGLFSASHKNVATGYHLAWIRDNVYMSLGLEAIKDSRSLRRLYHALLDILLKHEYKIDYAILEKPKHAHQYIHARYDPVTKEEINGHWGNKQNDAIGALLFKVADLEEKGIKIVRDENDKRILQKLVYYLQSIEYWHDKDNGMWEENEEVHASSVGACAAGLKKISKIVFVPQEIVKKGLSTLNKLLPRESKAKDVDMALLSLIYPYNIASNKQKEQILANVEKKLLRARGIIRYAGDKYYDKNGEAEWTMGLPWMAIVYRKTGRNGKYKFFMRKTFEAINGNHELPELYFANSDAHNENSPLGWSQSLLLVMLSESRQ